MLRNSEAVNCSFGPTGLGNHPLGLHTVRARQRLVPVEDCRGCEFPGSFPAWVLRYIEVWQLILPHAVKLLAIHSPLRDPCLPDLSEGHDLNSGVFGGADSTAPPSGCARHRHPAPQQYQCAIPQCHYFLNQFDDLGIDFAYLHAFYHSRMWDTVESFLLVYPGGGQFGSSHFAIFKFGLVQ